MSSRARDDPPRMALNDDFPPPVPGDRGEQADRLLVDVRPIPLGIATEMRTLECPPTGSAEPPMRYADFVMRADEVLDEIVDALGDDPGLEVLEERNSVTRARGLIMRRLMRRGRYSLPLAEIFSETGFLNLKGMQAFNRFRRYLHRYHLDLWIHEVRSLEHVGHIAFAIFQEDEGDDEFWYGARLLVTPFEVGQWRNSFLEVGCARPS